MVPVVLNIVLKLDSVLSSPSRGHSLCCKNIVFIVHVYYHVIVVIGNFDTGVG